MTEERENFSPVVSGAPRWLGLAVLTLAAASLLALGVGWSAFNHAKSAEQSLAAEKQSVEVLTKRLAKAEETNAQVQGELNVVTDRLKLTQGELQGARKQAKKIRADYSKQLVEMETSVKNELATKANAEDVKALGGDVSGVRSDLDATKKNFQMAQGELGTLIARNHEEIEQLRRLGQRDYYEFTIERKGSRRKVGSLMVELRGTNPKKNQFTLALFMDDMRLEKKNRSVNEPIYFYARGSRAALELVVNQVGKNRVVGYMSVPKAASAQASAAASGS